MSFIKRRHGRDGWQGIFKTLAHSSGGCSIHTRYGTVAGPTWIGVIRSRDTLQLESESELLSATLKLVTSSSASLLGLRRRRAKTHHKETEQGTVLGYLLQGC